MLRLQLLQCSLKALGAANLGVEMQPQVVLQGSFPPSLPSAAQSPCLEFGDPLKPQKP
jgi:hypothetical protein